ncbi:MAG: tetratricopeptide repeat protein [bacterium]|jgi:tetratricopeptide (TPR) repeat protein|nr:tetratricopeptide repeat protein [bacterium]
MTLGGSGFRPVAALLLLLAALAAGATRPLPDGEEQVDRLVLQGSLAEMRGDLRQAVAAYRRALELEGAPAVAAEALFRLSLVEDQDDGLDAAGRWLAARRPAAPELVIWLDRLYLQGRARELVRQLAALPDTLFPHLRIQLLLEPIPGSDGPDMARAAGLEASFGRLLALDAAAWERRGVRARLFWEQMLIWAARHGRTRQAAAWIDSSRLAAADPAAWLVRARLAALQEDLDGLRAAIARGRALDSLEAFHPLMAGRLALLEGDAAMAVRELRLARHLDPDNPDALSLLAVALEESGRPDEAESLLRVLLVVDPGSEDHWSRLAALLQGQGREGEALALYARALSLLGGEAGPNLRNNYAYSLALAGGNLALALELSRAAVDEAPDSAPYRDTLGWILFLLGRYADAEDQLERAYDLCRGEPDAEILAHLGHLRLRQGRPVEALALWRRALEADPGNPQLEVLIEGLKTGPEEGGR